MPAGYTLAIVNQKGGVGKSTTAVNLSASLARFGKRILLVDMDPQGNATSGIGINKAELQLTIYEVLVRTQPIERAIKRSDAGIDVVPSDLRLAGAEVELVPQIAREAKLRTALRGVDGRYEFVLIDCPPSLGLLTVNALAAANACLIPMQCEFYALEGLTQLLDTVALIRRHLNPELTVAGVALTMVDRRTKLSEQVEAEVRRHFGRLVFEAEVPRSIRLAEAPSYGQPVLTYAPASRGAAAYLALAQELLRRVGETGPEVLRATDAKGERDDRAVEAAEQPGPVDWPGNPPDSRRYAETPSASRDEPVGLDESTGVGQAPSGTGVDESTVERGGSDG